MDHKTLVFDISSDEEFGFDHSSTPTTEDFDWISKILDEVTDTPDDVFALRNSDRITVDRKITDCNNNINYNSNNDFDDDDDDDDDVVVVGEVIVKPKRAKRSFSMLNKDDDDDDDDCVVLECDPDKKPTVANDEGKNCDDDDDDSDDLVVVGEKGQVACRDFPHSRHLCANFPFSSTSHECRCDQCHCYVCDSLAPCAYWGSGALSTDHCNATDKAEYWQIERRKFRQMKILSTSKPVVSSVNPKPVQTVQHSLIPVVVSTCDVNPPFGVPNIVRQGSTPRPSVTVARNGYHPHLVSRQLSSTCNSNAQGNRAALSASGMSSRPVFKRPAMLKRAAYCSPSNVSIAYSHPQHLAAKPIENPYANLHGSSPRLVMNPSANLHGSSPRLVVNPVNPVSYQSIPRTTSHRHVIPRSHTLTSHLEGRAQPNDIRYTNSSMRQGQTISSPLQGRAHPSDIRYTNSSMHQGQTISSPFQVRAHPSDVRYTNSSMHQGQTFSSPLVLSGTSSALDQASQSSQQTVSAPDLCPTSEMPCNITQTSNQASGVALNCSSIPCNTMNDPGFLPMGPFVKDSQSEFDFDVDSWLEGNLSEGSFFDMNSQPSQTNPIDTGMLYFDFETSWKSLAHS